MMLSELMFNESSENITEVQKVSLKFRSKKLRKYHRGSDHRSSESIIEVQIKEAQKTSQKFRSKKLRKYHRSSDQRRSQ
jgi:hypothetical protein